VARERAIFGDDAVGAAVSEELKPPSVARDRLNVTCAGLSGEHGREHAGRKHPGYVVARGGGYLVGVGVRP
jgi:hypothetical protein